MDEVSRLDKGDKKCIRREDYNLMPYESSKESSLVTNITRGMVVMLLEL